MSAKRLKNSSKKVKNPSVLILTPAFRPNLGGVEVHLNDLSEYLRKNDFYTYVLSYQPITTKAKGKGYERRRNLEVYRFNWISGNFFNVFVNWHPVFNFLYLTPYFAIRTFFFLLSKHRKIDVIHAIGLSTTFPAVFFRKLFGIPVVMTTETIFNFEKGSMFSKVSKWVIDNIDHLLAQSDDSKKEFVDLGIPKNKITVFAHWINQDIFKPVDKKKLKKKLGWEDKFAILYVGRLIPEKGIRITVDVAKILGNKVQLQIIGDDGPELPYVKKAMKMESTDIHFIGKVPHDDLPPYYGAADVFVYPALYKEDMAYVLLDAMSCGTSVINTNPGSGIYKLSSDVGFVVEPEVKAIADKVAYLLNHPKKAARMGREAAKYAVKFGPKMAKTITDVYYLISGD